MNDLEQDLRAAAYHLGAAIPYLQRTGRTLSAMVASDEMASIENELALIQIKDFGLVKACEEYSNSYSEEPKA